MFCFDYLRIGLVQTQVAIIMSIDVQSRPMGSEFFGPGINALSSGWGINQDELRVLTLTSITNADCRIRLPQDQSIIYDHVVCMLAAPGNAICSPGNPLVQNGQIVGINLYDPSCDGTLPSLHERMHHFRPWILSVIA